MESVDKNYHPYNVHSTNYFLMCHEYLWRKLEFNIQILNNCLIKNNNTITNNGHYAVDACTYIYKNNMYTYIHICICICLRMYIYMHSCITKADLKLL